MESKDMPPKLEALVEFFRDHPEQIPTPKSKVETPLHKAAQENRPEICKELIQLGFSVNQQDSLGNTPLHYAFLHMKPNTHVAVVELLCRRGASNQTTNLQQISPTGMTEFSNYLHLPSGLLLALMDDRFGPMQKSQVRISMPFQNIFREDYFENYFKLAVQQYEKRMKREEEFDFGFELVDKAEALPEIVSEGAAKLKETAEKENAEAERTRFEEAVLQTTVFFVWGTCVVKSAGIYLEETLSTTVCGTVQMLKKSGRIALNLADHTQEYAVSAIKKGIIGKC